MADMDKAQVKKCVDYINEHTAALHGVPAERLNIGPEAKVEDVVSAQVRDGAGILVIDRGIKGTPKYILDLKEVQKGESPKKSSEAAEVEAKKVDALKERIGLR